MVNSASCVGCMKVPFGLRMLMGFLVRHLFTTAAVIVAKWCALLVSAIDVVLVDRFGGSKVLTGCARLLEVTMCIAAFFVDFPPCQLPLRCSCCRWHRAPSALPDCGILILVHPPCMLKTVASLIYPSFLLLRQVPDP
jgi:hypothetical protein